MVTGRNLCNYSGAHFVTCMGRYGCCSSINLTTTLEKNISTVKNSSYFNINKNINKISHSPFYNMYFTKLSQKNVRYFSSHNIAGTSLRNSCVKNNIDKEPYDVIIVGGGVTGAALLLSLSKYTNLKKILLVERRSDFATVASYGTNNSQTIHCGDIETNYTVDKARRVQRQADMLRNFATKLPQDEMNKCVVRMPKMSLAIGADESHFMKERFESIKTVFKRVEFIGKEKIGEIEPHVAYSAQNIYRPEDITAIYSANEHTAVDYYYLSNAFVKCALDNTDKKIDIIRSTEVCDIKHDNPHIDLKKNADTFTVQLRESKFGENKKVGTDITTVKSRFVVVSACGYSLLMAQKMNYGKNFSCLPIVGSFYFTPKVLNGKVYTCQNPLLPFAAVHGDADLLATGNTRFGPTAFPMPYLERYQPESILDFLKLINPDMNLVKFYLNLLGKSHMRNYGIKNFFYEIPGLNVKLFVNEVRKIIPSLKTQDLSYANGFGGVRPQLIEKESRQLIMGEGAIKPHTGIVFNITPSPGGTTCLGTAETDMREICERLGAKINEDKFKKEILEGLYSVDF